MRALYNTIRAKVPQGNTMLALMKDSLIVHRASPIIPELLEIRNASIATQKKAFDTELERLIAEEKAKE